MSYRPHRSADAADREARQAEADMRRAAEAEAFRAAEAIELSESEPEVEPGVEARLAEIRELINKRHDLGSIEDVQNALHEQHAAIRRQRQARAKIDSWRD